MVRSRFLACGVICEGNERGIRSGTEVEELGTVPIRRITEPSVWQRKGKSIGWKSLVWIVLPPFIPRVHGATRWEHYLMASIIPLLLFFDFISLLASLRANTLSDTRFQASWSNLTFDCWRNFELYSTNFQFGIWGSIIVETCWPVVPWIRFIVVLWSVELLEIN